MQENVILLFDSYSAESKRLHKSFKLSGCDYPAVSIEEDGYLPDGVQSVYGYFLGDFSQAKNVLGRPRYFNEIAVPDYWDISSSNTSGSLHDLYHERARIFYDSPTHKRHVKAVDWLDQQGRVRYTDHYNRYGAIYARTTFNNKEQKVARSFFSPEGKEILVENYVTRDIILNQGDTTLIFNNKTELVAYFLHVTGYDQCSIYFNSLSTPFFVSCLLKAEEKKDVLFWQEPIRDEIPGNMQMILSGSGSRTGRIYVQKRRAYQRLLELGASPEMVKLKGFVYPFRGENQHRPAALICTNSDQIEHLEEVVSGLPEVTFHIAAITEMSSKLMGMSQHDNVHLYPGAKQEVIKKLFGDCDFYLDINHANEIVSAVQRAFLHNELIFGFRNTLHNEELVDEENVFAPEEADRMIAAVRQLLDDPKLLEEKLQRQRAYAMAEGTDTFLQI